MRRDDNMKELKLEGRLDLEKFDDCKAEFDSGSQVILYRVDYIHSIFLQKIISLGRSVRIGECNKEIVDILEKCNVIIEKS